MTNKKLPQLLTNFTHDSVFRKSFENPILAKEFFDINLPEHVKAVIDTNNLKLEKESFVETNLKHSCSDLLFSTKVNDDQGYLYLLIENQNKPDPFMALRLIKYSLHIFDRHLIIHPKSKKLPLIYPMLFYPGKQPYNVARNIWDLSCDPKLAKEFWLNDYQLIDLSEIEDAELKKHTWYGTLAFVMKNIFKRDVIQIWEEIADQLPKLAEIDVGKDYIKILLAYSLTKLPKNDKIKIENLLARKLGETTGDKFMASVAQAIAEKSYYEGLSQGELAGRAEGKAEGIAKGKAEGIVRGKAEGLVEGEAKGLKRTAINMLGQNLSLDLIKQVTGLSKDEILRLKADQEFASK